MLDLKGLHSIEDVRRAGMRRLPRAVRDFIEGGAEDEVTIGLNRDAFHRIRMVPSALTDVSVRSQTTTLLGTPVTSPVILAPVGLAALAHPEGERAAARAASDAGVISTLSSSSAWNLEDVAAAASGPKWFQLYVWRDRELTREIVERARAAGYKALCLTVDVPVSARRERDLRNGFTIPPRPRLTQAGDFLAHLPWFASQAWAEIHGHKLAMGNFTANRSGLKSRLKMLEVVNDLFDPSMSWKDLEWLTSIWGGPIVVKGIMTKSDAARAIDSGAQAVWVSNHGGRQLDCLDATVAVLEEVVDAVAGRGEVYLDGGVRRGSDIVKAISLGANACVVGRPYVYGLAAAGEQGVTRVLELLRTEIDATLALLGRPDLASLGRANVKWGQ